jgi:hypothetical protein
MKRNKITTQRATARETTSAMVKSFETTMALMYAKLFGP